MNTELTSRLDTLGISQRAQQQNGRVEPDNLGQDEFMLLMLTQFQNQDPTKPMDQEAFLGQLAQFSTVSGIDEMNASLAGLNYSMQSSQTLEAASLIGHEALIATSNGYRSDGSNVRGAIDLPEETSAVIEVHDSSGQVVDTFALPRSPAGLAQFDWDGTDPEGQPLPDGEYHFSARTGDGEGYAVNVLIAAEVTSVSVDPYGGVALELHNLGPHSLASVRRII